MTFLGILITIISSVLWGVFDGIRKFLVSKTNIWTILFYLSFGFTIFFFLFALYYGIPEWSNDYIIPGLITVVLNLVANLLYIKAIKVSDISSSVPFLAFTSFFTTLTSYFLLGEALTALQILGIFILVAGSLIINGDFKKGAGPVEICSNLFDNFLHNKGSHLMIGVSFLWALSAPFDKMAVAQSNASMHGFYQSFLITLLIFIYIAVKKNLSELKEFSKAKISLSLGSLVACTALGLQFFAYTMMKVPIFESLKRGVALFTAMLVSLLFFKEKINRFKVIGASLIIFGATLILVR